MKREEGFIYPHVLAVILLFLLVLGSMAIGFQKELKSAELTISFYQKQQLFRLGLIEAANKLNRICDQPLSPIVTEEGRVTLKRMGCDDRKKLVRLLVNIETKGGVTDERELEMNKETGEINEWNSTH
ncbi:competence type IV pilus minor pilin ComGG [Bacillus aerius]|uniref:competence type IV pilus minor pilin ComGG n=1 Tax=Bacillus aerius TaxID=293388 RepID=UPI0028161C7B|nr:competence type IV pilus minor pilin ComGG [Bacillus aerius]WMT30590.1 competence type IV pilus minor pilin ComGG [Bacillus aerius]